MTNFLPHFARAHCRHKLVADQINFIVIPALHQFRTYLVPNSVGHINMDFDLPQKMFAQIPWDFSIS
jgi:hypothetical protein